MNDAVMLLALRNAGRKMNEHWALRPLSLQIPAGLSVGIAGETGSGKSTLLRLMAGLISPTEGSILYEGTALENADEQLIPGHPAIAYLSQHYELRNRYTVWEMLDYGNKLGEAETSHLLFALDIKHLLQRQTTELSGGEKQRVALAKALTQQPRLLLLDEPFSNLDALHRQQISQLLYTWQQRSGATIVMATHQPAELLGWAAQILILRHGQLQEVGKPLELYYKPRYMYTAALLGLYNMLNYEEAMQLCGERIVWPVHISRAMIRPEQLMLRSMGHGIEATVEQITFQGAHYLLVLRTETRVFYAWQYPLKVSLGAVFKLTATKADIHLIQ